MAQRRDSPDKKTAEFIHRLEEVGAIAQNGLTFTKDPYDVERYQRLQRLVSELLKLNSEQSSFKIHEWLCLDRNYATPKMDVRALVIRAGEILLVQERSDKLWTLPGGWCDINRSPRESVEREVLEESGLEVRASRLLALFDKHKHDHPPQIPHAYKCFFLCDEKGGHLVNGTLETISAKFFPMDDLPLLSMNRVTPRQLQLVVAIAEDPARATAFD